jgi:hypothetical protein
MSDYRDGSHGQSMNRRGVLKKLAASGVGLASVGASSALSSEKARAASRCPYDAVDCTGAFNKRIYDDAGPDVRITQSSALAYYGADYFRGKNEYVHQFQLFNFGQADQWHTTSQQPGEPYGERRDGFGEQDENISDGKWVQSYSKDLNYSGFKIQSPHEVTFGSDSPRAGAGAPKENSTADVLIRNGRQLAALLIGSYFSTAGMAYSALQLGASIKSGLEGSDNDNPNTLSEEWGIGAIDTDFAPALTTYTSFRVHVPAAPPCLTSNIDITTHSALSDGSQYVKNNIYYSFENPNDEACGL